MGIDPKRTLQFKFPEITKEWHYEKNFPLTPLDISYGSKQKVWWQSMKDDQKVFLAKISDRTKYK